VVFGHHATLFCFLMVASFCDLEHRDIPLSITSFGTLVGLVGAVLWPWPWPYTPAEATPVARPGMLPGFEWLLPGQLKTGLYPWPVWGPLPAWLQPGGNWQTGLATGLAGMLIGSWLVRAVRYLFSKGLGAEALGLGDADILMMAGAFLGWQPVVIAFFVAVAPALLFGVAQLIIKGDNALPFGPSLAVGLMTTWLGWQWIGPRVQMLFFQGEFMLILAGGSAALLLGSGYALGWLRNK
jgi:leader peptidase (prepilin peptidase)/N-methyltransferase